MIPYVLPKLKIEDLFWYKYHSNIILVMVISALVIVNLLYCILLGRMLTYQSTNTSLRNCIVDNGFQVVASLQTTLTKQQAEQFYSEHQPRFFYQRLITSMCSGPSVSYILCRTDAIKMWRQLMGPTKVYQAQYTQPNSLRGQYGLSDTRNATHGSDSPESARREIAILFPDFNVDKWLKEEEKFFRKNLVKFDAENFVHRIDHCLKEQ